MARVARRIASAVAIVVVIGCGTRPPAGRDPGPSEAQQTAASPRVTGHWALDVYPAADDPTTRMWLELQIDSVADGRLFGRLTSYLAGDVGIDPSVFPRFDGEITGEGTVFIRIGHADRAVSNIAFRGTLLTDTIPLDLFVVGPDTVSGGARRWRLVRRAGADSR